MKPLALKGHERPITRVRLNEQGDILFSSSKDKWISIWYTDNGERIGTYEGHNGVVWDVDVSWDTTTLVSASGDSTVKVWDVETGICRSSYDTKNVARSIALSYSSNLVAFTTQGRTIQQGPGPEQGSSFNKEPYLFVADIRERNNRGSDFVFNNFALQKPIEANCEACLFSHLDDTIVIGTEKGRLLLYEVSQPKDAVNFETPHNYAVRDLQLSANQGFIVSASADKTAQLHNARDLTNLKKYKSGRPVNSASISPTRDHIILGGGEEAMKVTMTAVSSGQFEAKMYHMIYEEEFARFAGHFGPINSILFGPSGTLVVSGAEDGFVRIQELDQSYIDYEFNMDNVEY